MTDLAAFADDLAEYFEVEVAVPSTPLQLAESAKIFS
jgi:hypothetical protein